MVEDSRNICHWALIILVTPLHQPGSANAAASVCLYREKERPLRYINLHLPYHTIPLRCRPIIWPHPTAGLWISCTQGPVGNHVPRRVPSLRFDRCAMAPETWPLPTISRAHPPVTSTNYSAASDEGRRRFPQPVIWGPIDHCIPRSRSPCSPLPQPFCDVLGAPLPSMSINRWHPGIGRGQHRGRPPSPAI